MYCKEASTVDLRDSVLEYGKNHKGGSNDRQTESNLESNGVPDSDVWQFKQSARQAFLLLLRKLCLLTVLCIICVPPVIVWTPFKLVMDYMSEQHRKNAKARSNVKIKGQDVVASYKIIWLIIFLPFGTTILAFLVWVGLTK